MSRLMRFPIRRGRFLTVVRWWCSLGKAIRIPPWENGIGSLRWIAAIFSGLWGIVAWLVSRIVAYFAVFHTPREGRGWLYSDPEEEIE